jgi:hypothetical protein
MIDIREISKENRRPFSCAKKKDKIRIHKESPKPQN